MKLYIYTGEMLQETIAAGEYNEISVKNKLISKHDQDMPYAITSRVYFPEGKLHVNDQLKITEVVILQEKDKRNIQLFTQSPWVLEYAWWLGKKHGFETKVFHVIQGEDKKPVFEDPDGEDLECVYKSVNKAIGILESIQEEVESKENEDGSDAQD